MGCLGTPPRKVKKCLERIGIEAKIVNLQKTVIIYSARIPWKVVQSLLDIIPQEQFPLAISKCDINVIIINSNFSK